MDRNNTPDIWSDIQKTIKDSSYPGTKTQPKDCYTVVLLPKMETFDWNRYAHKNPICPHLTFECIRRIFGRKDHSCLSAANKPKAVEVVLKFVKLHDGFNFSDREQVKSYFDHYIDMDFMKYADRDEPLMQETIDTIVDAYNMTPDNFENPPDATIDRVVTAVVRQMKNDKTYKFNDSPE